MSACYSSPTLESFFPFAAEFIPEEYVSSFSLQSANSIRQGFMRPWMHRSTEGGSTRNCPLPPPQTP